MIKLFSFYSALISLLSFIPAVSANSETITRIWKGCASGNLEIALDSCTVLLQAEKLNEQKKSLAF